MKTLTETVYEFPGGLHLDEQKSTSSTLPITVAPIPAQLILPLSQHIGDAAVPCVSVGDYVLKGQCIAHAEGQISVDLHATSSGTVTRIGPHTIPHPSGLTAPCIIIDTDGKDQWRQRTPCHDFTHLSADELRQRIRHAGIVGMGGAGFPSAVKLDPGVNHNVETLILNGAECEPFITCDDMLMRERATEVIEGLRIMRHLLQAKHCIIGIEDNKIEAYAALRDAIAAQPTDKEKTAIILKRLPTKYPAGGERQLIYSILGKQVPSNKRPISIGVVCHNVATAAAVYRAIIHDEPLLSRIVTLAGSGIPQPRNVEVAIGTPINGLLEYYHASLADIGNIIMGGPMMGFIVEHIDSPVIKTTNCLLATLVRDSHPKPAPLACIRCGDCADVCPAGLLPQQLYWFSRANEFDPIQEYHLFDCIECGCCDYVCPSHIPIVQYIRHAKTAIWQQEADTEKSNHARLRHEQRLARLERVKREKKASHNRKKAALQKNQQSSEDPKKAAILAAMARASKRKEDIGAVPKNTAGLTAEQQRQIDEADARRAAEKQKSANNTNKDST